ncbi:PHA/PHB synthase family protein [Eilatimonas milleporae]|uniref:Polyhydroxyalkanoate synthase n=1 Tax=Eilatimonas milleporae TaxID=911205 RepID=A0A3M0CDG1_9PROT|nr:class I poly(R)-hydroxyalkanoic acid synthase [Eilatimonas milleporae]RMB05029.1 polyhydroxyalkanoate synthase [Eilatimonas milleporae]
MSNEQTDKPDGIEGLNTGQEEMESFVSLLGDAVASSQKMMEEFLASQPDDIRQSLDPMNVTPAFLEMSKRLIEKPDVLFKNQVAFWQDYMQLISNESLKLTGETADPVIQPQRGDKRFKSENWNKHSAFDFLKQFYLLTNRHVMNTVGSVSGLDSKDTHKIEFFTKQLMDAISPSNFVFTNPDVLNETIETQGQNLLKGMQHFAEDIERGQGIPLVKMTDLEAFKVGENLATTPGKVVYRNRLFELIQYTPTTEEVYATPLVIFPPWINKYYILDLSAEKSFVRWAVEKGYSVFMVSWVNPDESHAETSLDDMLKDGFLEAITVVREITGAPSVHTIGYCVAGTMLSAVLAYLTEKGWADTVKSATFFTAQVDFETAGDLTVFVDEEQLSLIDKMMEEKGYLDKKAMALTFNMLRANDLIWSYVVNNYLLGKEPMAFDLLYWNCDSTNLPRRLHRQYLRHMYQNNELVQPGALVLDGVPIDLRTVETPSYVQAGRQDHIAPPDSVYKITRHFKGPIRFVLAGSGHIAGVVNPPSAKKYQHWTNDKTGASFEEFVESAKETPGSWWPDWHRWLSRRSGKKIPALDPEKGPYPALTDAPGDYVRVRHED